MSFLKNRANQSVVGTLVQLVDGVRYTSTTGMTVRVAMDGVWSNGMGTLAMAETHSVRYEFTQAETDAEQIDVIIDHVNAAVPIAYTIYPRVADFDPASDEVITDTASRVASRADVSSLTVTTDAASRVASQATGFATPADIGAVGTQVTAVGTQVAGVPAAVRTNLSTELGRIDEDISAEKSIATASQLAIAGQVDAAFVDGGDGTDVLTAIVAAIGNTNINETTLVAAIRSDLERVGGSLATAVASAGSADGKLPATTPQQLSLIEAMRGTDSALLASSYVAAPTVGSINAEIELGQVGLDAAAAKAQAVANAGLIGESGSDQYVADFAISHSGDDSLVTMVIRKNGNTLNNSQLGADIRFNGINQLGAGALVDPMNVSGNTLIATLSNAAVHLRGAEWISWEIDGTIDGATRSIRGLHTAADSAASDGQAIADAMLLVPTGKAVSVYDNSGGGQSQPRQNEPAGSAFRLRVSSRADGRHETTRPVRLRPGAVNSIAVSIDVAPLFGGGRVKTVGTPTVSSGDITAAALGPRDDGKERNVMISLAGTATAGEQVTVDVPVEMVAGEIVDVRLPVHVLAD